MEDKNLIKAFNEIALDILDLFKAVLKSDVGINRKVNKNTLVKSRLAKTATVDATSIPFIDFSVNEYVQYIESGRRPRVRRVPIDALREWAMRKGIKSDNSTLFKIQQAIYRDGISPRPILTRFFELLDKEMDDVLLEKIIDGIIKDFEKIWDN